MDPNPPFYFILVRISHSLFGVGEFATRLPAMSGFVVSLFFLFKILHKRCSILVAFSGIILLGLTGLFKYSYEARGYSWVIAFCTMSFFFWQIATEKEHRKGVLLCLSISLTAGVYTHFYAALLFVPIVMGEIYRTIVNRKIDWLIYITVFLATIMTTPLIPLVFKCMTLSPQFWALPSLSKLIVSLRFLFLPHILLFFSGVMIAIAIHFMKIETPNVKNNNCNKTIPPHEIFAAFVLTLIPFIGYFVSLHITNAYTGRYFLSASIGGIISLGYISTIISKSNITKPKLIQGLLLIGLLCIFFAQLSIRVFLYYKTLETTFFKEPKSLQSIQDLPVVILNPHLFTKIHHYSNPTIKKNVYYLIDDSKNHVYHEGQANTADISLSGLRKYTNITVWDYNTFTDKYQSFYLFGKKKSSKPRIPFFVKSYKKGNSVEIKSESKKYRIVKITAHTKGHQ